VVVVATAGIALTFMTLMGALIFLPLFLQLVLGVSAAKAGLLMSPMMAGVVFSSVVGGRRVSATGRYKRYPVIGLATALVAFLSVSRAAAVGGGLAWLEVSLVALGLGLGLVMPNLTVAIQNAVPRSDLGVATASLSFFRSLGGALGAAISGAILTSRLSRLLPGSWATLSAVPALDSVSGKMRMPSPMNMPYPVVEAYRHAIGSTFVFGAGVAALALLVVLLLPELPLRGGAVGDDWPPAPSRPDSAGPE
jgi:MFS family permease